MKFFTYPLAIYKNISNFIILSFFSLTACLLSCQQASSPNEKNKDLADVVVKTDRGDIFLALYDATPKHKANFLKLANEGFFDGIAFHRIVRNFVIQAGDPRTKLNAITKEDDAGYNISAEIVDTLLHYQGRLSAARYADNINPNWESSSSQFFIVTGKRHTSTELDEIEQLINSARENKYYQEYRNLYDEGKVTGEFNDFLAKKNFTYFGYSEEQRNKYLEGKGTPSLDLQYTVFGEVVAGMDVVREIELVPTRGEQPLDTIRIQSMEVLTPTTESTIIN